LFLPVPRIYGILLDLALAGERACRLPASGGTRLAAQRGARFRQAKGMRERKKAALPSGTPPI
jgi:hypothetical protein